MSLVATGLICEEWFVISFPHNADDRHALQQILARLAGAVPAPSPRTAAGDIVHDARAGHTGRRTVLAVAASAPLPWTAEMAPGSLRGELEIGDSRPL